MGIGKPEMSGGGGPFGDHIEDQSDNAACHDVDSQALFPLVLGERAVVIKKQVKAN